MTVLIESWTPRVGVRRACTAFGVSERTFHHCRQAAQGRLPRRPSRARRPSEHKTVPWKIPDAARDEIRGVLC